MITIAVYTFVLSCCGTACTYRYYYTHINTALSAHTLETHLRLFTRAEMAAKSIIFEMIICGECDATTRR